MKATIIDWVKKIVDVESNRDEFIRLWKTKRGLKDIRSEKEFLNPYEIVETTQKIYKKIILSYPRKSKREIFYVNHEDAQEMLPVIDALVYYRTEELRAENNILTNILWNYRSRWINKLWDWIVKKI